MSFLFQSAHPAFIMFLSRRSSLEPPGTNSVLPQMWPIDNLIEIYYKLEITSHVRQVDVGNSCNTGAYEQILARGYRGHPGMGFDEA